MNTAAPPSDSVRTRAMRGSAWAMGGYAAAQTLRLGSNLILARLLFPEAFGLMALVNVFLQGLNMMSDVGVRGSVFFNARGDDPRFLDTAWTIQIVRGVILWILCCAIAAPVAILYGEPVFGRLLPFVGLTALVSGFNSTAILSMYRRVSLGRITILDLIARATGLLVMITWAIINPTVWALAIGGVVASTIRMILSHAVLPSHGNRLHWDRRAAGSLFGFGKWVLLSTFMTFIALQLDRLLLGKLITIDLLGVYSIALIFAMLPRHIGLKLTNSVLYPVFAEFARNDRQSLDSRVRQTRDVILSASLLGSVAIALLAPAFFEVLYDDRYLEAGWIAQLLSISVWFSLLQASADRALVALGDSRSSALANTCNAVVTTVGCLLGFRLGGLAGLIFGTAAGNVAGQIVIQRCLSRHGINVARADLSYSMLFGGLFLAGVVGPHLLIEVVDTLTPMSAQLSVSIPLLLGAVLVLGYRICNRLWPSLRPSVVRS